MTNEEVIDLNDKQKEIELRKEVQGDLVIFRNENGEVVMTIHKSLLEDV